MSWNSPLDRGKVANSLLAIAACLSLILISWLTFKQVLDYWFAHLDELTLIDVSRVHSVGDAGRLFISPLFSGISDLRLLGTFYRPVTAISFGLDYAIWGLDPYGYHLTDLFLHIAATLLGFWLIRSLTGDMLKAWIGAAIFTIHPILAEVIPTSTRRMDVLATTFVFLSLILFIKFLRQPRGRGVVFLGLSQVSFMIALASKETAIILPFIVLAYLVFLHPPEKNKQLKGKLAALAINMLPFLVPALFMALWRLYVLGGLGGYESPRGVMDIINASGGTAKDYFLDLIYPDGLVSRLMPASPGAIAKTVSLVVLFLFLLLIALSLKSIVCTVICEDRWFERALKSVLLTIGSLSLFGVLAYPWLSFFPNDAVIRAKNGHGYYLGRVINLSSELPDEYQMQKIKNLIMTLLCVSFFISIGSLMVIHKRREAKIFLTRTQAGKQISFLLSWMLIPLVFFVIFKSYAHYYIYIAILPLCAILAILMVDSFRAAREKIIEQIGARGGPGFAAINYPVAVFLVTTALSVSFIGTLPFSQAMDEWRDGSALSAEFFSVLSTVVPDLPSDAIVHVKNLHWRIYKYDNVTPRSKQIGFLYDYSIKSWLDMNYPENQMEVTVRQRESLLYDRPDSLTLEVRKGPKRHAYIDTIY